MSTISHLREPRTGGHRDEVSAYCEELFAPLTRADQRRWGEVYLRGLLHTPGRKTPSSMSERVLGRRFVQPIQQFVNQSTWDAGQVRRQLAERYGAAAAPQAWAFDEVVFPKNGTRSVGVGRQFVRSAGRMINCQLALATSLVHRRGCLPVNWHLMLPRHWDADDDLRAQAHVPPEERHRPRWRYVLDSVDEMLEGWDVPPAPVLADWSFEPDAEPLLLGLEERGLGYLVEVGAGTSIPVGPGAGRLAAHRVLHRRPAGELAVELTGRADRAVLAWRDGPAARARHSQFLVARIAGAPGRVGPRGPRHLVVEWPFGRSQPKTHWVTNLPAEQLAETVSLAELRHHSRRSCELLHEDYGLGDFEGRSFRGWHHHVTLVSAARGYHTLQRLRPEAELTG